MRAADALKTGATTVILLGAGALIGSFWVEWRGSGAASTADPSAGGALAIERRLKVEVLNGSGDPGAARIVGDALLAAGYDVVAVANADAFDHPTTHVLDRSGAGDPIAEVADAIGADSTAIAIERDLLLDATVILGRDWRRRLDSAR